MAIPCFCVAENLRSTAVFAKHVCDKAPVLVHIEFLKYVLSWHTIIVAHKRAESNFLD